MFSISCQHSCNYLITLFSSSSLLRYSISIFFFFNDTATTEIYTLSLHDALPISAALGRLVALREAGSGDEKDLRRDHGWQRDRKSTRLNSSHTVISYAVFCLKKKKKKKKEKQSNK